MDALDLLEQQHREALALTDHLLGEPSAARRGGLVITLARTVEAHSRVEERCFYAALRARIDGAYPRAGFRPEALLYEALEGHALMRFAAVNLLRTRATDVRFEARVRLVRELFLRHASIEEDWCFPKAKRLLCDEDLDVIGVAVANAHEVLMQVGAFMPSRLRGRRAGPTVVRPRRAPAGEGRARLVRGLVSPG
jgi:Hemerythrin HHE cation binding domain